MAPRLVGVVGAMLFGVLIGVGTTYAIMPMSIAVLGLGLAVAIVRAPDYGALAVGAYWAVLSVRMTVFSDVNIGGLFYPFYLALLAVVLSLIVHSRLRVAPQLFWFNVAFLAVVAVSFLGFQGSVDSETVQKVVALLICPLVVLNVQTSSGLRLVSTLSILAGLVIAGWIIFSSAQGGFSYRGDVTVNQNVAAFVLAAAFIQATSIFLADGRSISRAQAFVLLAAAGIMAYGLILLASRGMSIAAAVSIVSVIIHAARWNRRAVWTSLLFTALLSSTMLLPGATGILDRFEGESVDSAGDRLPIWTAVVNDYVYSPIGNMLVGNGFGSSEAVVRRTTGLLTSTHNSFVTVLYEFGIAGLALFLWLHALVIIKAVRMVNPRGNLAIGLTMFLLSASLSASFIGDFLYWLALGMAIACVSIVESPRPQWFTPKAISER